MLRQRTVRQRTVQKVQKVLLLPGLRADPAEGADLAEDVVFVGICRTHRPASVAVCKFSLLESIGDYLGGGREELKDPLRSRCPADNCLKVILVSIPKMTVSRQKMRYISAKSGRGAGGSTALASTSRDALA